MNDTRYAHRLVSGALCSGHAITNDCPFSLVNSAPHEYRISYQQSVEAMRAAHWFGFDERRACSAGEAANVIEVLAGQGCTGFFVTSPQCDGNHS